MPLWARMAFFVIAMLILALGTSIYVHRRGSALLGLGRAGRIVFALVLGAAPLLVLLSRRIDDTLPGSGAFAIGAVGNTVLLGVWISTVLLWLVDIPAYVIGKVRARRGAARVAKEAANTLAQNDPQERLQRSLAIAPGAEPVSDAVSPIAQVELLGSSTTETREETALDAAPSDADVALPDAMPPLVAPAITRRSAVRQVATGAALTVGFGSAFYGAIFGRHDYEVNEVPVRIPGLSPNLSGYRITQLSDIHFGVYVGETELRSAVSLVRATRPDLIVLTGDLVDHDPRYASRLGRLVRALEQLGARDGVAMIPGNHDYYAGVEQVLSVVRGGGGTVLRNAGRRIGDRGGSFSLVGVDDIWSERNGFGTRADLDRALAMVPRDVPKVLLCHNPSFFPEARDKVALQISGHTHGGQVNLGLRPADYILPYVHGLYEEGESHLYVNRGFGTAGPPARVQAPPEVTVLILTA